MCYVSHADWEKYWGHEDRPKPQAVVVEMEGHGMWTPLELVTIFNALITDGLEHGTLDAHGGAVGKETRPLGVGGIGRSGSTGGGLGGGEAVGRRGVMSDGGLAKKLAEVMGVANRIPKRGRNDFHKYDYATEADIAEAIRKELADRHVILLPSITRCVRESIGDKGSVLTSIDMLFTFVDGDSGEQISRPWMGAGTDKEDKGLYKAMTGGEKYFLLKTFLMPTGDDPERESKDADAKATVKATAAEKKARPPLPEGAVYLEKVTPRSKGNQEWAEVVLSTGEEHVIRAPQLIALAMNIAQENVPAVISTTQNAKGKTQVDMIERWKPPTLTDPFAKELTADDIFTTPL